jgi:putative intracellular protease/amidase
MCRAEELAAPYYLFLNKGYFVDVASIGGGPVPIDPLSTGPPHSKLPVVKRFLADGEKNRTAQICSFSFGYPARDMERQEFF